MGHHAFAYDQYNNGLELNIGSNEGDVVGGGRRRSFVLQHAMMGAPIQLPFVSRPRRGQVCQQPLPTTV